MSPSEASAALPAPAATSAAESSSSPPPSSSGGGGDGGDGGDDHGDCPICLEPMTRGDVLHPLQCHTRGCGYNFCLGCVERLLSSSRDDYVMASDGNRHVKVFLHCPQCRSDLGPTIRDTALLRRAENLGTNVIEAENDSELSASELRMRSAMNEPDVRNAVQEAQRKETEFFGGKVPSPADAAAPSANADANAAAPSGKKKPTFGRAASAPLSASSAGSLAAAAEKKKDADDTLYSGYEYTMTSDERRVVTEMMTAGSVTKLAAAALFLNDVVRMSREGRTAASREKKVKSSVEVLIDESKVAKEKAALKAMGGVGAGAMAARLGTGPGGTRAGMTTKTDHRNYERELQRKKEYMRTHPLPVRMPKYVELALQPTTSRTFPLTFVDDEWNGTVSDAFAKITVSSRGAVDRKPPGPLEEPGIKRVLKGGCHTSFDCPEALADRIGPVFRRVVVASVRAEGGRKGVMKGDVVTHLNGEDFTGTAAELNAAIQAQVDREGEGGTFSVVLNAERSTAEALRRRALV